MEAYIDDCSGDNLIEASLEGSELFGDVFVEDIVRVEQAIVILVVVGDLDEVAVLHQFFHDDLPELFELNVKIEFHLVHRFGGGEQKRKRSVGVRVNLLQIFDDFGSIVLLIVLVEQFLVDDFGEVGVEMDRVVEGQAQQHPHELKPQGDFVGVTVEPVETAVIFRQEHVEVGIEDGLGDELEILVFDSPLVSALLPDELNPERTFQVLLYLAQLLHRVVEDVVAVDGDAEIDEALQTEPSAEIVFLDDGGETPRHVLADVHLLLVDGLDLHELVLVVEVEKEGVVDHVELPRLHQDAFELLHRLEHLRHQTVIEFARLHPLPALVAAVQHLHKVGSPQALVRQYLHFMLLSLLDLVQPRAETRDDCVQRLDLFLEVGGGQVIEPLRKDLVVVLCLLNQFK